MHDHGQDALSIKPILKAVFSCFSLLLLCFSQFFSSGLAQHGKDNEGFDGFLIKDIKKEISRAKRLVSIASLL